MGASAKCRYRRGLPPLEGEGAADEGQRREADRDRERMLDGPFGQRLEGVHCGGSGSFEHPGRGKEQAGRGDGDSHGRVEAGAAQDHERWHAERDHEQLGELDADVEPEEGGDEGAVGEAEVLQGRGESEAVDEAERDGDQELSTRDERPDRVDGAESLGGWRVRSGSAPCA